MSWLSGWDNRAKLTISNENIDSNLSNFPLLITLSSGAGINNYDITRVFDELGSSRKKIAVTTSNGTSQCSVEIEYWDAEEKFAYLWAKVPTVYSAVNTTMYLYYDKDHADNTSYVGDITSTPGQTVWSAYELVYHMNQDPSGGSGAIKDSTSNVNHGTPDTSMALNDLVAGKIDGALDFDGVDDDVTTSSNVTIGGGTTFSWIAEANSLGTKMLMSGASASARIALNASGVYIQFGGTWPDNTFQLLHGVTITDTHLYTLTWDADHQGADLYVDGQWAEHEDNATGAAISVYNIAGKDFATAWTYLDGILDEIRLVNTVQTAAWIKADYYSNWDGLISFEHELSGYIAGTVYDKYGSVMTESCDILVSNLDGSFVTTDTSSNDGSFNVFVYGVEPERNYIVTFFKYGQYNLDVNIAGACFMTSVSGVG